MSDINLSYFPARLRELRKSHKLTQAQMAARLGIAPASLSYYESGERLPDLRVMDTLYNEFDVSFEYMLGYTQSPLPPDPTVLDFLDLSPAACDNIVEQPIPITPPSISCWNPRAFSSTPACWPTKPSASCAKKPQTPMPIKMKSCCTP